MTIWQISSRDDRLSYYAAADSADQAIKLVEALMGPQNPAKRVVIPLDKATPPVGFKLPASYPGLLDVADEDEE